MSALTSKPNRRDFIIELLADIILSGLCCFALLRGALSTTLINFSDPLLLVMVLLMCSFFVFFTYSKRTFLISGGTLLALAALWWLAAWAGGDGDVIGSTKSFFSAISGADIYEPKYDFLVVFILSAMISLFSVIFTRKIVSFAAVAAVGMLMFATEWIMDFFFEPFSFYLFLVVLLMLLIKRMNLGSYIGQDAFGRKKSRTAPNSMITVVLSPVLIALVVLCSLTTPKLSGNVELFRGLATGKITSIYDVLNMMNAGSQFSVSQSGFGASGRLGGDVKMNDDPVMEVSTDATMLYLAGSYSREYTGTIWKKGSTEFQEFSSSKDPEYIESAFLPSINEYNFKSQQAQIYPKTNIRTLFHPPLTTSFSDKSIQKNDTGEILSTTYYREGEDYKVYFRQPRSYATFSLFDYELPGAERTFPGKSGREISLGLMSGETKGYYTALRNASLTSSFASSFYDGGTDFRSTLKTLSDYASEVYKDYLLLPDKLPQRVKDFAAEATAGIDKDQYFAKAEAIRKSLLKYKYTLSPGSTPTNQDFVDYFLFNGKKGYCTYFATSMVVLCRAEGIPARYTEGFVTPKSTSSNGRYLVTNQEAHAWAECYFEGVGWMVMEATPPYYQRAVAAAAVHTVPKGPTGSETSGTSSDSPSSAISSSSSPSSAGSSSAASGAVSSESLVSDASSQAEPPDGHSGMNKIWLTAAIIAGGTLLLIFALIMLAAGGRKRRLSALSAAPYRAMTLSYYLYILKLAEIDENSRQSCETALDFGRRLVDRGLYTYGALDILRASELFTAAAYSDPASSEDNPAGRSEMQDFYKKMLADIRKKRGFFRLLRFYLGQTFSKRDLGEVAENELL